LAERFMSTSKNGYHQDGPVASQSASASSTAATQKRANRVHLMIVRRGFSRMVTRYGRIIESGEKMSRIEYLESLLSRPVFFTCERHRCRLLKIRFVQRQIQTTYKVYSSTDSDTPSFQDCRACPQGKRIRRELKKQGIEIEGKRVNGAFKIARKGT